MTKKTELQDTSTMSSPYAAFKTDKKAEAEGIRLDYGDFWFQIGRAGGSNTKFAKILERLTAPHRRAIENQVLPDSKAKELMAQAYAEGVVFAWGSKKHGDGRMPDAEGNPLDFSVDNVVKVLTDLPDLFMDIQEQAGRMQLFRQQLREADAGN